MKNKKVTEKQKKLLQYIYDSLKTEGFPPSFCDIKTYLQISSNQTVIDHLQSLESKELIERKENSARGITIKPKGYQTIQKQPLVSFAGLTAAGQAIQAIAQNEWVTMPSGYQKYEDVFIVKISGNSMVEVNIYDGDLVLIKKSNEYKNGDIVLARIGDEVTLKTFISAEGRTYLKPENPACRNIAITHDTYFLGKFIKNLNMGV